MKGNSSSIADFEFPCSPPVAPDNGYMKASEGLGAAKVRFLCHPGFRLSVAEPAVAQCNNGSWSLASPSCFKESLSLPIILGFLAFCVILFCIAIVDFLRYRIRKYLNRRRSTIGRQKIVPTNKSYTRPVPFLLRGFQSDDVARYIAESSSLKSQLSNSAAPLDDSTDAEEPRATISETRLKRYGTYPRKNSFNKRNHKSQLLRGSSVTNPEPQQLDSIDSCRYGAVYILPDDEAALRSATVPSQRTSHVYPSLLSAEPNAYTAYLPMTASDRLREGQETAFSHDHQQQLHVNTNHPQSYPQHHPHPQHDHHHRRDQHSPRATNILEMYMLNRPDVQQP